MGGQWLFSRQHIWRCYKYGGGRKCNIFCTNQGFHRVLFSPQPNSCVCRGGSLCKSSLKTLVTVALIRDYAITTLNYSMMCSAELKTSHTEFIKPWSLLINYLAQFLGITIKLAFESVFHQANFGTYFLGILSAGNCYELNRKSDKNPLLCFLWSSKCVTHCS